MGMEDVGAEVVINAQWSGGASLLRCIDPEGQGDEGAACRSAGRESVPGPGEEQELRPQVTARLAAQDRLASQPQI